MRRGGKKEDAKQEVEDDPERERLISHMLEKEEANMKMHHIEVTKAHMGQVGTSRMELFKKIYQLNFLYQLKRNL